MVTSSPSEYTCPFIGTTTIYQIARKIIDKSLHGLAERRCRLYIQYNDEIIFSKRSHKWRPRVSGIELQQSSSIFDKCHCGPMNTNWIWIPRIVSSFRARLPFRTLIQFGKPYVCSDVPSIVSRLSW